MQKESNPEVMVNLPRPRLVDMPVFNNILGDEWVEQVAIEQPEHAGDNVGDSGAESQSRPDVTDSITDNGEESDGKNKFFR